MMLCTFMSSQSSKPVCLKVCVAVNMSLCQNLNPVASNSKGGE